LWFGLLLVAVLACSGFWRPERAGAATGFRSFSRPLVTGVEYDDLICRAARITGLSGNLLRAVMRTESGFDDAFVSRRGDRKGLMGLSTPVIRRYGVRDPFAPAANIMAGSSSLQELAGRYRNIDKALSAYRVGAVAVAQSDGIPPLSLTRRYVNRVRWYKEFYQRRPELFGLDGAIRIFNQGLTAFARQNWRRAAYLFGRVLGKYQDSPEAAFNLALVEEQRGNLNRAQEYYRLALANDRQSVEAAVNLAVVYERLDRLDDAIRTWKLCLDLEPDAAGRSEIKTFIRRLQKLKDRFHSQ
jgi:tetratricopeptide (TPR) repeat protein